MADPVSTINNLVADPAFSTLSEEEQKHLLGRLRVSAQPKADYSKLTTPETTKPETMLPPDTSGAGPREASSAKSSDFIIENILRPFLPKAAAGLAAGPTAGFGAIPAYLGTDVALQKMKSQPDSSFLSLALGAKPGGLTSDIANTAEQVAILGAGQKILGGVWKAGKAFLKTDQPEILKFLPTASQALKAQGTSPTTAGILKWLEDHFAPGAKAEAQAASGVAATGIGEKLVAKQAGRSVSTATNPQDMASLIGTQLDETWSKMPSAATKVGERWSPEVLDKKLANPDWVNEVLSKSQAAGTGTNLRQDFATYRLSRIQQDATTLAADGRPRIDSAKLFEQFNDPNMKSTNKLLFNGQAESNIKQFYKNVAAVQDKAGSASGVQRMLLWENGVRLPASLTLAAITGHLGTGVALNTALTGLEVGTAGLAKLLTKQSTARLMLALANNEALGVSDMYAARAITQVLSGTTANLVKSDGTKTPVQIKDGKFTPVE